MKKLILLFSLLCGSAYAATTNSIDNTVVLPSQGGTGTTNGARQILTATTNFYVTTGGSDSNACTLANPCLTINHALTYVQQNYDLGGQTVNINVADGTYSTPVSFTTPFVGGIPNLIGDVTTPANCIITSSTATPAFYTGNGVVLYISGFKITNTGTSGDGIQADTYSVVNINGNMTFGAASGSKMHAINHAIINITTGYTDTGNANYHWYASDGGLISDVTGSTTITLTSTPTYSVAYAGASRLGEVSLYGQTFSGSASGVRYSATYNAMVNTGGNGSTYIPGSTAGTTSNGGVYN